MKCNIIPAVIHTPVPNLLLAANTLVVLVNKGQEREKKNATLLKQFTTVYSWFGFAA